MVLQLCWSWKIFYNIPVLFKLKLNRSVTEYREYYTLKTGRVQQKNKIKNVVIRTSLLKMSRYSLVAMRPLMTVIGQTGYHKMTFDIKTKSPICFTVGNQTVWIVGYFWCSANIIGWEQSKVNNDSTNHTKFLKSSVVQCFMIVAPRFSLLPRVTSHIFHYLSV